MCWSIRISRRRLRSRDRLLSKLQFLISIYSLRLILTIDRLAQLEGDWHEFESKALRKENERKDKEARRQAQSDAKAKMGTDKDKKRGPEGEVAERDPKRVQIAAHPAEVAISKIVEMTG